MFNIPMTIGFSVEKNLELPFIFMAFEDINGVYFDIIKG